ncbi:MAG: hypothetical protein IKG40_00880 [Bacilli bacterium]|nr:hypothetical protein [Bacilli bacterium]
MKNILEFAKKAKEAYINYINGPYDPEECKRISDYINNIDNLTEEEENELTEFINANVINLEHVADIQIPEDNKKTVKSRLDRMKPMKISKTQGRIYEAKGHFEKLIGQKNVIKIRRLTKFKPKKTKTNQ